MTRYKNTGGNSGVYAYEIGIDSITVQFTTGAMYVYNYRRPGQIAVEQMKALAMRGRGLNSFISTVVRKSYWSKLR